MNYYRPEIYYGMYFAVETTQSIEIVPADLTGRTCSTHVEATLNYLDGAPLDDDALIDIEEGWLARLITPSYLGCTDWSVHKTEGAAEEYLRNRLHALE